ncbi:OmpA family protein [uncultured Litoreibacter sp.]|uniref:OmpA family protein n=1 Tax=uncultured Litoreibacter sp. TaxID=1392394 RepID=UPI00262C313E|nr:OmpA family protein [uncultured Litoreibacter sp.]
MRRLAPYLLAAVAAQPVAALDLAFSGPATQTFTGTEAFASYKLPIGPFRDGAIATLVAEGPRLQTAWKVESASGTTLGVADNLRQQIEAVGFELLYECETQECGGFDFRFETEVLPEPNMHIDLGDYRYLAAQRLGGAVPEYLSLFVSRSATLGYVQMILIGGGEEAATEVTTTTQTPTVRPTVQPVNLGPLIERLETRGSAVLQDLQFETGSSELAEDSYQTLQVLADYLKANPSRTIALVGHTDAEGSLQGNIGLSRKRAQAAANWLVKLGVPSGQVEADGVGYLAPVASNLTEEGRTQNRRVEAILTSTQ